MVDNKPQNPGRIVAGRYRLGARLGSGVEAAAFEAFDEQLQRMVVLKVVHPELGDAPQVRRQFRATMANAAGIDHPNVAPILDFGTDRWGPREVLYFVTEHYSGGSLRDLLDRGRLLAPSQALVVGLDACKGLDAIHRHGLVHSDIRPATLVFGDDRRLRVVDAGLYQALHGATDVSAAGPDRVRYSSPEQAQALPVDARSDVYSLCLTLIESLSGSVPFEADSAVATLANRVDKLMPVSADPGPLAAVLERAGRPNAADRFTAAEFGRALVQAAEKLPRPAPIPIIGGGAPGQAAAAGGDDSATIVRPRAATIQIGTTPTSAAAAPTQAVAPVQVDLDEGYDDDRPRGSKTKLIVAVLAVFAVAAAALAYFMLKPEMVTVPDLATLEEAVALNQVSGDFDTVVQREPSEEVAAGIVIRTDPPAGTSLEKGKLLTIVVSSGPPPSILLELKGLTLEIAREQLEAIGLSLEEAEPQFSDDYPEGQVMAWTIVDAPTLSAGDSVTKGTVITVTISKGPAPRIVPDLIGKSYEEATIILEDMGLVIAKGDDVFDPVVPVGMIAVCVPAKDSTVTIGDTITVNLSKGVDMVALPAVAGDYNAIIFTLQTAGFTIGRVNGNVSLGFLSYSVNGVPATPGQTFPRGTAVELFFKPK